MLFELSRGVNTSDIRRSTYVDSAPSPRRLSDRLPHGYTTATPRLHADGASWRDRNSDTVVRPVRSGRLQQQLVRVAPAPVLVGLPRAHQRVAGGVPVRGRVPAGRVVAAAHVPTLQALPQVHPLAA